MSVSRKRTILFTPEILEEIENLLIELDQDSAYNTGPGYSANTKDHPDNQISFVDKHLLYLKTHPTTDPYHYIANLRIMTRIR